MQKVQVNSYLLWISFFYVAYLALKIWSPSAESMYSLMGSLMVLVGALAGIQACASFGGSRNFTGRIALYFTLALLLVSISMLASSLASALNRSSSEVLSITIFTSFIAAQIISTIALMVSVRSVIYHLSARTATYILLSALFSIAIAWFNVTVGTQIGLIHSSADQIFWSGLLPVLIFLQLASALVLIDLLGKWYGTHVIRTIALGFVCFDLLFPPATVYVFAAALSSLGDQVTALLTGVSLQAVTATYIVSFALTQMKPKQIGPFCSLHSASET
jgi:hypothetical protein